MSLLNIVLLVIAGLCLLIALFFVLRGLGTRNRAQHELYSVGRQAQRHAMQINLVRGAAFLVAGLICLGVYGLSQRPIQSQAPPTATPTSRATQQPTATTTVRATTVPAPGTTPSPAATPTTPQDIPTLTPTATATTTPTPEPPKSIVVSPNGLYLREAPGGTQELELIADGTELILLEGSETVDDLLWRRVLTPAGNEGWVAASFITVVEDQ